MASRLTAREIADLKRRVRKAINTPSQTGAQARAFRSQVSRLKKSGLIPKSVDARSASVETRVGKASLDSIVKRNQAVARGEKVAVKVPKNKLKAFREAGYKTSKGRVIYDVDESVQIKAKRGGISRTSKNGIERIEIPVPYHNLEEWIEAVKKNRAAIDAMKKREEFFAFRFFGHNSSNAFGNITLLMKKWEQYESVTQAEDGSRKKQAELFRNLEIVRVPRSEDFHAERKRDQAKRKKDRLNASKQKAQAKKNNKTPRHRRP